LNGYGIDARTEEIVTCGAATAAYLRENGFESVHVLGSDGLSQEMEQSGLRLSNDVLAYRAKRQERSEEAMQKLTRLSQELGLYD
jgi:ribonucleotide monophosphatase NagD (HAD superfamily)